MMGGGEDVDDAREQADADRTGVSQCFTGGSRLLSVSNRFWWILLVFIYDNILAKAVIIFVVPLF